MNGCDGHVTYDVIAQKVKKALFRRFQRNRYVDSDGNRDTAGLRLVLPM